MALIRLLVAQNSVAYYLQQLDTADRQEPSEAQNQDKPSEEKIEKLKEEMRRLAVLKVRNARHSGPADIADRS